MGTRNFGRYGSNQKTVGSVLVIVLAALVLIGFLIYLFVNRPPDIDLVTNCPKEPGVSKRSISFLIDMTDRLSPVQEKRIKDIFYNVVDAAEGYDRIQIYEVNPADEKLLQPIFYGCKPADDVHRGPTLQKFSEARFKSRLQQYFDDWSFDKPTSPIIAAIGAVAASFPNDESYRHLIIASDLIENSDLLDQFKPNWRSQATANKKALFDKQPNLEGVEVSLLFIPRANIKHHDKEFADWWLNYLRQSGAHLTRQEFHDPKSGNRYAVDLFIPITG